MLPIGPLMIEHRLIEKMIAVIRQEIKRSEDEGNIDSRFVDAAVDFIRIYADRCHHGKEEEILFRDLSKRKLPGQLTATLSELLEEHRLARKVTAELVEANREYEAGHHQALTVILDRLRFMASFYPRHIDKEDKHLFLPCMRYFSPGEQAVMLNEELEFDRNFIHRVYEERVGAWSAGFR